MADRKLIKPPRLRRGDTIAIWSPSFPGGARYPRRLGRGVHALHSMGFNAKLSPLCCADAGYVSASPEDLGREFHQMLLDNSIRCVMTTMGGWLSARILPYIDYDLVREHPKIYIGYSDIVSLLLAIYTRSGLVTFHGPAVLSEMGEANGPWEYTVEHMLNVLMTAEPVGRLLPPSVWTDEFLAWDSKDVRRRAPRGKARWIGLREGIAEGKLVGGCLPTIDLLYGTPYFPSLEGSILFLEHEEVQHDEFCAYITSFRLRGVFDRIKGLIIGRLSRPNFKVAPDKKFEEVLMDCMGDYAFPIAWNVDLGHTEPKLTLPIGVLARLVVEGDSVSLALLEGAVL